MDATALPFGDLRQTLLLPPTSGQFRADTKGTRFPERALSPCAWPGTPGLSSLMASLRHCPQE